MGRLMKNIGLALLFLVAVLVLLNIFVFMPRMHLATEQTTVLPAEESRQSLEGEDAIVADDTLAIIRKIGNREEMGDIDHVEVTVRNPFYWPEEKTQQKKVVKPDTRKVAPQAAKQPQLSMVIIGEGRRQALLEGVFVQEGDRFLGYKVKAIEDHQIILVDKLGELRIYLAAAGDGNGQPQTVPGLIEK